jgi:hypothetical protein
MPEAGGVIPPVCIAIGDRVERLDGDDTWDDGVGPACGDVELKPRSP